MDAFTLVAKLILDKGEFNSGLKGAEDSLNSDEHKGAFSAWGTAMGQLAARAIETAVRATLNFAKSVLDVGMNFDAQMSYVQSIGQMTDDELEAVRNKALELGASTKFTAEEVGQAFGYMALAGWDTEEMLGGIDGILSLAAASGEDLGLVSDIVTDALTAFGLTAKDTTHFVDVLAAASANSNTTVAMMGEAFKYLATTGGVLGYTIDDVAVVLGLLANNGIKASQAGTSMRQVLNTLIAPTDDAAEAMENLGLYLFEAGTDKRKPLLQVLQEMRGIFQNSDFNLEGRSIEEMSDAVADLDAQYAELFAEFENGATVVKRLNLHNEYTMLDYDEVMEAYETELRRITGFNEEFLASLSEIGGLRGIGSLLAIMKSTDSDFEQLVDSVAGSEGAAQTMAETMIDNLRGDITILNSALDGLKILISDEYKGAFREFVQMITAGIGDMSKAFSEGGLVGLFTNLTDWVLNGITDVLSNESVTGEGATRFGVALGTFVGHLISTLVTSAPQLISGLFEAGMNLAGGIVQGLFAGLMGTGEGSVYGFMTTIENEKEDAIAEANRTAVQASGIVGYLESLTKQYGEAAKDTKEWADAMDRLEKVMPGVNEYIKTQGGNLTETVESLKAYVEQTKQAAVLNAQQKALESYQQAYADALTEQATAEANLEIARSTMASSHKGMVDLLNKLWLGTGHTGPVTGAYGEELDLEGADMKTLKGWVDSLFDMWTMQIYNEMDPDAAEAEYNTMKATIEGLTTAYNEAEKQEKELPKQIEKLRDAASKAQTRLEVVERALKRLEDSAGALADGMDGMDIPGGDPEGSHAKGLNYVPYDNYVANLHRGEMILNQNQARNYRNGANGVDGDALYRIIADAVAGAVEGIQINMDGTLVGNAVTKQVSRNIYQQQFSRRYTTV